MKRMVRIMLNTNYASIVKRFVWVFNKFCYFIIDFCHEGDVDAEIPPNVLLNH